MDEQKIGRNETFLRPGETRRIEKKIKGDEDENAAMEPSELCVSDHGVSHISPSQMPARSKRINTGVDPRVERHVVQEHGFRDAQQY